LKTPADPEHWDSGPKRGLDQAMFKKVTRTVDRVPIDAVTDPAVFARMDVASTGQEECIELRRRWHVGMYRDRFDAELPKAIPVILMRLGASAIGLRPAES
jgi:hypothetical protein